MFQENKQQKEESERASQGDDCTRIKRRAAEPKEINKAKKTL